MNTQKKIRILYINTSSVLFGAERRLLDILNNLDKEKFEPVVALPAEGPLGKKLTEEGVKNFILDFKFKVLFKNIGRFFELNRHFLNILKEYEIDIIHVNLHYLVSNFWLAFLISRKPVIIHLRAHAWLDVFEKFVFSRCHRILCVSEYVRQAFFEKRRSDFFISPNKDKLEVLYDGIDVEKFRQNPELVRFRREVRVADKEKVVGLVGAIDQIKGQDIFIHAARRVCDVYPNTRFVIVGDVYLVSKTKKAYKEKLPPLIRRLHLEKNVFIFGFQENVPEIMNSLDILVQPSSHEALGTSLVEAMACRKPVVGTRVDGIPEVIGSEGAGILMELRTPQALAEAILYYLENPEEAKQAGEIARRRVEELFDTRKNVRRLEDIYLKLAGRRVER